MHMSATITSGAIYVQRNCSDNYAVLFFIAIFAAHKIVI